MKSQESEKTIETVFRITLFGITLFKITKTATFSEPEEKPRWT